MKERKTVTVGTPTKYEEDLSKQYVCEDCGKSLPDNEVVRLADGETILCGECYKKAPRTLQLKSGEDMTSETGVAFLTVGLSGGLLDYVKLHKTEAGANADADRISHNYGIDGTTGEDHWHDEDSDVYVTEIQLEPDHMTAEEWRFFEDVWLEGMKKVRLTDGWDSDDDRQRLLEEVDRKLLKLKPS
jgi:hypothetical protein